MKTPVLQRMSSVAPLPDPVAPVAMEMDEKRNSDDDDSGLEETTPERPPSPATYKREGTNLSTDFDTDSLKPEIKLHQCARNGYDDLTKSLLEDPKVLEEIDNVDEENLTALHYAARYNHHAIVKLLVEKGADVFCKDDDGLTPLHYACRVKRKRKKTKRSKSKRALYSVDSSYALGTPRTSVIDESLINDTVHVLIKNGAKLDCRDDYGQTPLHHAALRGDEVACEQLLSYQELDTDIKLIDEQDIQLMTPLHTAATQNQPEIVKMLIDANANMRSRDEEESTPLHEAATAGNVKVAKILFEACKRSPDSSRKLVELLSDRDEDGNTPLMLAVESGRYKFAVLCIESGAAVNLHNKQHLSPLHLAAVNGDVRIVKLLLQNGAKIEALTYEHATPLHKAAQFNNTDCVEALIESCADIEAKDKDNFTPLLLAICYGHAKTVQALIRRGADVTVEDKADRSTVYWAAFEDQLDVLQTLLKTEKVKTLINDKDQCNNGPLHIAAYLGHLKIVQCLLDNGADLYSKNDEEQTPIHKAASNGWSHVVKELVKREKNSINDGDEDSNTALHLAASEGHIELVETLLDLGADVSVRNSSLRTPLGCAAANGYSKTVKLLIEADSKIDPVDKTKLTPLLIAARNGHAEVVDLLLEERANVCFRDPGGLNCLDMAVDNDNQDVAVEIIKSDHWMGALRNATMGRHGCYDTPMRKLIRRMPEVAQEVFNKCINMKKPDEHTGAGSHVYEITFNYEFLDDMYNLPKWLQEPLMKKQSNALELLKTKLLSEDGDQLVPYTKDSEVFKKNHPMMIMVTSNREELLAHPLIHNLLQYKWVSFGRLFYYINFCSYTVFLLFLTGYVVVSKPPYMIDEAALSGNAGATLCDKYQDSGEKQHLFAAIGKYFILVLAFMNILKETFQAFHGKRNYLTWDNVVEVTMFVSTVIFVLDHNSCQAVTGYRDDWQWNFGAVAIVLAWIELVLFFQKFPELGIYVVMFRHIIYTFFKFFIVFVLFIVGFGLGFFCLIQNQDPYSTAWQAIIKTSVMMIGEFDYDTVFHENSVPYFTTYILFVIFLVIMTIIIMNLLVGLAVDDIKGVLEQSALKRIAMKVALVLDIERIIPMFSRRFHAVEETIYRKSYEAAMTMITAPEEFENQIQKSQQRILKKVDKIKNNYKKLRDNLNSIDSKLEALIKAQRIQVQSDEMKGD